MPGDDCARLTQWLFDMVARCVMFHGAAFLALLVIGGFVFVAQTFFWALGIAAQPPWEVMADVAGI